MVDNKLTEADIRCVRAVRGNVDRNVLLFASFQASLRRTAKRSSSSCNGRSVPVGSGETKEGTTKMSTFIKMIRDESGASAAEYALILAIVGSALALAAIGLGNTISGSMNTQAARITNCQDGSC